MIYNYICTKCGNEFELRSVTDDTYPIVTPVAPCPVCKTNEYIIKDTPFKEVKRVQENKN